MAAAARRPGGLLCHAGHAVPGGIRLVGHQRHAVQDHPLPAVVPPAERPDRSAACGTESQAHHPRCHGRQTILAAFACPAAVDIGQPAPYPFHSRRCPGPGRVGRLADLEYYACPQTVPCGPERHRQGPAGRYTTPLAVNQSWYVLSPAISRIVISRPLTWMNPCADRSCKMREKCSVVRLRRDAITVLLVSSRNCRPSSQYPSFSR